MPQSPKKRKIVIQNIIEIDDDDVKGFDEFKDFDPDDIGVNNIVLDVHVGSEITELKSVDKVNKEINHHMYRFLGSFRFEYMKDNLSIQVRSPWDQLGDKFKKLKVGDTVRVWGSLWKSGKYYSILCRKIEVKIEASTLKK